MLHKVKITVLVIGASIRQVLATIFFGVVDRLLDFVAVSWAMSVKVQGLDLTLSGGGVLASKRLSLVLFKTYFVISLNIIVKSLSTL